MREFARVFSWRRRLPRSSVVAFLAAGVCAGAAFFLVRGQAARIASMAPPPRVTVVVAAADLPAGTRLEAGDLALAQTLAAPPAAIGAVDQAVGSTLVAPIAAGEPLTRTRLASSSVAGAVEPGRLVVEVPVALVPGGLSAADLIDVYATFPGARPYTTLVGAELRVLAVRRDRSSLDGSATVTLTLDVDAETARTLLGAAGAATLGVAVHGVEATPAATASPSLLPPGGTGAS